MAKLNLSLSVIIPTWNNPIVLLKNIDTLTKNLKDIGVYDLVPIIIADDGSNDKNHEIIECSIIKYGKHIQYYYHENIGLERNELYLINKVKTKYVLLLGEDDFLPKKYINKVVYYLQNEPVGTILSNFYVINQKGVKTNRSCRNRIKNDKIYPSGSYNLMFLAHQMSGLVFQTEGIEKYFRNVPDNVYPQLSFVANSINKGVNIHITDSPFACTVLNKKRFNYSVDGLTYDLLKNIIPLPVSSHERSEIFNYYLLHYSNQFCNPKSWKHPVMFLKTVNSYSLINIHERKKIKLTFILSYFIIPFRLVYRLIFIPILGKIEEHFILPNIR